MSRLAVAVMSFGFAALAQGAEVARVVAPPLLRLEPDQIELKNDGFLDEGGQAFLQLGFVQGEKAGVWVNVPAEIVRFKVDYFRVLFGSSEEVSLFSQAYFQMGSASVPSPATPSDIANAVEMTPGPYWNDIPAQGDSGQSLPCVAGGQWVGAALEFTQDGAPSVYRDLDGLSDARHNTLMAIPGGWAYSAQYGLRGDWIMRIVGHEATEEECGA